MLYLLASVACGQDGGLWDPDNEYYEEYEDYEESHFAAGPGEMPPAVPDPEDIDLPLEGEIVRCKVQTVKRYGAFLDLHQHAKTLLHVKDMNRGFVPDAAEFYHVGQEIAVQVVSTCVSSKPGGMFFPPSSWLRSKVR